MKKVITKNDKVYLQVLIPRELYEKLVKKAFSKYGRVKGILSYMVEEALGEYLNSIRGWHICLFLGKQM